MLTHVVFGAGLGYAFLSTLSGGPNLVADAAFAVVLSYAVNQLIDGLGHSHRDGWSVRSPLTHSVFTAPVWGVAVSYVLWAVGSAYGLTGGFGLYLVAGVLVAYSHLFLDSMTGGRGVLHDGEDCRSALREWECIAEPGLRDLRRAAIPNVGSETPLCARH